MASQLESLPNEVLTQILSCFPTASLLPLLTVSQDFHTLVRRVLHHRLLYTWPLPAHGLILELYNPSRRYSEPYLDCCYLGNIGGLSRSVAYEESYADCAGHGEKCAKLKNTYSRFQPRRRRDESRQRLPIMGSMSAGLPPPSAAVPLAATAGNNTTNRTIEHIVNLDSHELFSQLCLNSSLCKLTSIPGVFSSLVEAGGGVIRVWRNWLADQAKMTMQYEEAGILEMDGVATCQSQLYRNILWVDWRRDVGLKVHVREIQWPRAIPIRDDSEDSPISYAIEIQELFIRTSHLLLAIERSIEQQEQTSGKAMIFGSLGPSPRDRIL